jgi:hypothetical protein
MEDSIQKKLKKLQDSFPNNIFRISQNNTILRKFSKKWKGVCKHNRIPYQCVLCNGTSICVHKKRKNICRECDGSQLCEHGTIKGRCVKCGGKSICVHKTRKSRCKLCGGSELCLHKKLKYYCLECGGKAFCEHNIQKYSCVECNGGGTCKHKKRKQYCRECTEEVECEYCNKKFLPNLLSAHLRIHKPCEIKGCPGLGSKRFNYILCYACGCENFGRTPQQRRQDKVFEFIEENFGNDYEIIFDDILPDQKCSKKRPDIQIIVNFRKIIIEIDENQHKATAYTCEAKRMSEIATSGEILPCIFIRFNPDTWKNKNDEKKTVTLETRFNSLKKEINKWLNVDQEQDHFVQVIYLYYDGEKRQIDHIEI